MDAVGKSDCATDSPQSPGGANSTQIADLVQDNQRLKDEVKLLRSQADEEAKRLLQRRSELEDAEYQCACCFVYDSCTCSHICHKVSALFPACFVR